MPLLVASLLGGLAAVLASLVGRILLALFITYVTYTGLTIGVDFLLALIKDNFSAIGGDSGAFVKWLWLDRALSLIISSYFAALAIKTTTGTITKMVIKK
jgi:hypothetical protein